MPKTTLIARLTPSLLLAGALLASGTPALAATPTDSTTPPDSTTALPQRYLTQQLTWKPCYQPGQLPQGLPPGSERLECSSFTTPQNWNRPTADATIAISRLRPTTGPAAGSVLTNPGGPGGPGRTFPLFYLQAPGTTLLDTMEVIGIDVRGTGDSSTVSCAGFQAPTNLDPRDRDPGTVELILDTAELNAKYCQVKSGELGRNVTTEQTVKDFDLLRHLLGRDKIHWLGYSGGSWLGAYYATYFPHRVGRFVLDSNTEFTAPWNRTFDAQPKAFERRARQDLLPWIARNDATYHLGATGDAVRLSYEDLRAKLATRPLPTPKKTINPTLLDTILGSQLYSKRMFPQAGTTLSAVRTALAHPPNLPPTPEVQQALTKLGDIAEQHSFLDSEAVQATFYSILCNDMRWPGTRRSLTQFSEQQGRQYPLAGWRTLYQPCIFWQRPHLTMPTPTGAGVPPVLMVQSTNDPATSVEGATAAHAKFAGSRLLTITNEGDHGIYGTGNPCANTAVESYLIHGVIPTRDATCPGMPLPNPTARTDTTDTTGSPLQEANRLHRLSGALPR